MGTILEISSLCMSVIPILNRNNIQTFAPHVNVLIPRYAPNALTENNILGTGAGQVQPDYVLLSHILEMAHAGVDASRWSLDMALERASKINCDQTYVLCGEKRWSGRTVS